MDPKNGGILQAALLALDLVPSDSLDIILAALERGEYLNRELIKDLNLGRQNEDILSSMVTNDPAGRNTLLIALKAGLRARRSILATSDRVELSWTAPIQFAVYGRSTHAVMLDMIDGARSKITITGYSITETARDIVDRLMTKAESGVGITFVMHGDEGGSNMGTLSRLWRRGPRPRIYMRKGDGRGPYEKMHAKMIVADGADLLVTSANLTWHGMRNNLEIGVRVRGRSALKAQELVDHLISTGYLDEVD